MPKPTYNYIWSFDEQGKDGQEAPKLKGVNGSGVEPIFSTGSKIGGAINPDIEKYTYIDVSRQYTWTLNDERDEVPRVILKELVQDASSLLTRSQYYLGQSTDALTFLGAAFTGVLSAYKGLYATRDTGFYYDLPSLEGTYLNTGTNNFGQGADAKSIMKGATGAANAVLGKAGGADSKIGQVLGKVGKLAEGAGAIGDIIGNASTLAGGGAGYFTEQPQFFQHGGNVRNYTVKFPLYNTGDYQDMIRNFQLAFMLVYQNLPNRASKQLVMPPCIYEVTVPGVSYSPFSYMSSVDVQFIGSRREVTIDLPFDEKDNLKPVRVTIPEAYDITLNIQELVAHTRNFMYHNVNRKITTGVRTIDDTL